METKKPKGIIALVLNTLGRLGVIIFIMLTIAIAFPPLLMNVPTIPAILLIVVMVIGIFWVGHGDFD